MKKKITEIITTNKPITKKNNMKEKIKNILIDYGYGDDVDTVEISKTDLDVIAEKIEDLFDEYYNQNNDETGL